MGHSKRDPRISQVTKLIWQPNISTSKEENTGEG
jgi:hypothetical protein